MVEPLTRGRSLVLLGSVEVSLNGETIKAVVEDRGVRRTATITPTLVGHRTVFESRCSCRLPACVHLAAGSWAALDRFPALKRVDQKSFLDTLAKAPPEERRRLAFGLEAAPAAPTPASSPSPMSANAPARSSRPSRAASPPIRWPARPAAPSPMRSAPANPRASASPPPRCRC